ncbi:MAG: ATPase, T2SS/T4P/T4SS family [Acidobacteriota bacterium]
MKRFIPKDQHRQRTGEVSERQSGELTLLSIPGVGRSKAQMLINAGYRSLQDLLAAPLEELRAVPGLGPKTAAQVQAGARQLAADKADLVSRPSREGSVVPLQRPVKRPLAPDLEGAADEQPQGEIDGARAAVAGDTDTDRQVPGTDGGSEIEATGTETVEEGVGGEEPDAHDVGMDSVDVRLTVHIENSLLAVLPPEAAREFEVLPLQRVGESLLVAAERPLREAQLQELSRETGMPVKFIPSRVANVTATLRALYDDNKLRSKPKGLGEILIDMGLLTSEQLGQALAQQMRENNPSIQPILAVEQEVLQCVPEALARRYNVLPIRRIGEALVLATSDHLDKKKLEQLTEATGLKPYTITVGPSELAEAMSHCYRVRQSYELRQMWLGEILISRGLVSREQLDRCLAAQKESRQKLGQLLIENDYISEDALYPILAEKLGMEYRRMEQQDVDYQLSYLISERFAERNLVLPLKLNHDEGTLEVAIADPTNIQVRDMLESVAENQGQALKLVLAAPSKLKENISYCFNFHRQMEVVTEDLEIEAETDWEEELDRHDLAITEELPKMRRIVNKLLYEAVTEGASDIHIENLENRTQVRFRIDGILHERTTPLNKANIQKIISVLKIDSGLNIAERRRAQDGVFKMRIGQDRNIDFRINVHATQSGEDAVIRVLDRSRNLIDLGGLGLTPAVQARYESLVKNPQGLILITGPTGSGKTTMLYSTLAHLNRGDKKIVTAEDPVEYHLDGVTQYQVNSFIGNTFAEYTRRFLRKDPDIILVGEIRDDETAESCLRAAMTGHLVFSTLHTNDAIAVVQRLRDFEVDSSSIADALLCVMQQRLARRNCPDCRKPYQPDSILMREFFPEGEIPPEAHFVHGTGCSTCHGKGLMGRVGLYEFWEVKRATRQVIAARADEARIRESADGNGLTPLVEDALRKVYQGITTLEELRRVVPVEQIRSYTGYYNS